MSYCPKTYSAALNTTILSLFLPQDFLTLYMLAGTLVNMLIYGPIHTIVSYNLEQDNKKVREWSWLANRTWTCLLNGSWSINSCQVDDDFLQRLLRIHSWLIIHDHRVIGWYIAPHFLITQTGLNGENKHNTYNLTSIGEVTFIKILIGQRDGVH